MTLTRAPERPRRRLRPAFAQQAGFAAAFVVLVAVFTARSDAFVHLGNLRNILGGAVVLALVSLAMTAVVASGGIDLSVGTSLDIGAWVVVVAMLSWHLPWGPAIVLALVAATTVGLANALLIARLGVSPFLATLGVYFVGRSIQQAGTDGGATVNFRRAPDDFHNLAVGDFLGLPTKVWLGAAVAAALWFVLARTVHGRRIDAIGLQPAAASHGGVPLGRYTAGAYIGAALVSGLAGVLLTAGLRIFTPLAGFAYQTDAIAAVFIGASLHPRGRANVPGTLAAVAFIEVLANGLDLMGLDFNVKVLVRGLVLVAALALSFGLARRSVAGSGV